MNKKLLKIGMLNPPQSRWRDALSVFSKIYIFQTERIEETVSAQGFDYLFFDNTGFNRTLVNLINRMKWHSWLEKPTEACIRLLRQNNKELLQKIAALDFSCVHVSYNDFDDSALLFLLCKDSLNGKLVTRAYKETRPGFNLLEKKSFEYADRIVLTCKEEKRFIEGKYGPNIFTGKEIVLNLDEDFRESSVVNSVKMLPKYSNSDRRRHVVILAGRVFSDPSDERSGARLFYLPKIKEFVAAGFAVHLHTKIMIPDANGINQYEAFQKEHPDSFFIERPLDLAHDLSEYSVLSRYDYGILHNFIDGTTNSAFDKVNIPNRYYEYQIAHVIPIVRRGETLVTERMFNEMHTGIVYSDISELEQEQHVVFSSVSMKEYFMRLYGNAGGGAPRLCTKDFDL